MKLTFVFFAIAIMAAIGIGFWLSFANPLVTEQEVAEITESMAVPATPAATPEQISGNDSLASLLEQGEALECSFRFSDSSVVGEGTSFVSDGQLRVDAQYEMADGGSTVSSFILTDETTYVWSDAAGESMGLMFATSDDTMNFEATAEDEANQFINPTENVQYTCAPWDVDNSVFAPPTSIEFFDMQAMMQGDFDPAMMNISR